MRISTEIRNRRMMGFLLKGKPPKEVARKFNLSVWAVYKAQKQIQNLGSFWDDRKPLAGRNAASN